jgi:hypothetical protein
MLLYLSIFNSISIPATKLRAKFDHRTDRKIVCLSVLRLAHVTSITRRGWQRGGDGLIAHESTILIARSCQDSAACGDRGHVERKWPANNARHTDMRSATPQGRVTERVNITRADNTALYCVIAQQASGGYFLLAFGVNIPVLSSTGRLSRKFDKKLQLRAVCDPLKWGR